MEFCRTNRLISMQVFVDVVLWISVGLPVLYLFLQGTPVTRGFFCDDESLSYPYKPDSLPTTVLVIAGFGTAISVIILVEVLNCINSRCKSYCQKSEDLFYCAKGYAVFLVGFVVLELIVETVKNKLGFLRPNFFDLCRPDFNRTLCPGYISVYTCTNEDTSAKQIREVRQSFPSGHSAFSMYIASYFCLYVHNRLNIGYSKILKFFIQSGLLLLSLLCGLQRISDNKHHPSDIIVGFGVGAFVAILVYKSIGKKVLADAENPYDTYPYDTKPPALNSSDIETVCCTCSLGPTKTPKKSTNILTMYSKRDKSAQKNPKTHLPDTEKKQMTLLLTTNANDNQEEV